MDALTLALARYDVLGVEHSKADFTSGMSKGYDMALRDVLNYVKRMKCEVRVTWEGIPGGASFLKKP